MRSKTSFFNRTLCLSAVKRFWPLWAAYLGIWFLSLPLPLYQARRPGGMTETSFLQQVLNLAHIEGLILGAVFSVFAAMAVWSFLYNARSASGTGCLPVRREGQFLSALLAGLLPLAAANLLTALLTLPACLIGGYSPLALAEFFAIVTLIDLFFYGFATLCAQLTGHILVLPAVYAVLNFVSLAVEFLVRAVLSNFVYGMPDSLSGSFSTLWLCPPAAIGSMAGASVQYAPTSAYADATYYDPVGVVFEGWWVLLVYALAGLVCMALALLLFRRRKLESAGDVVAVPFLRPVFRWCMALGYGLVLASLMEFVVYSVDTRDAAAFRILLIFFLIGAFDGWFAGEMLMKKSFRVFKGRTWAGFGVCCAVILVLMLGMRFDLFGYERRVPKTENIKSAQVYCNGNTADLTEPENLAALTELHRAIIADKTRQLDEFYSADHGPWVTLGCRIAYTLQSGRVMNRYYILYSDMSAPSKNAAALQDLLNAEEAILNRNTPAFSVSRDTVTYAQVQATMPIPDCARAAGYTDPEAYLLCEILGYGPAEAEVLSPEKRRILLEDLLNNAVGNYYYDFIGWSGGTYNGPGDLERVWFAYSFILDAAEAETLYRTCLKPDLEEGSLGRVWLLRSKEQEVSEYTAIIEVYCENDRHNGKNPEVQTYSGELRMSASVYSRRTNAWLESRGLTLHTVGEAVAAAASER